MTSRRSVNKDYCENTNEPAVVLSICYSGGLMGAAVYLQECTTIKLLSDIAEDMDFHLIDSLIHQVEPTIILLNKDQDILYVRHVSQTCGASDLPVDSCEREKAGVSTLQEEMNNSKDDCTEKAGINEKADQDEEEEESDELSRTPKVHLLSNVTYNFEGAKKRIAQMFSAECYSEDESSLIVNFRLDISNVNMIRALGSLLIYMDSARTGVEYEALNKVTPITSIKSFIVDQMMEIDAMTYRALEIFGENRKKEVSWKKVVSSDGRKASLFSLCNRSRSALGRYMLRKWFEHPTLNIEVLEERQMAIQYLIQENNADVVNQLLQHLGQIRSLRLVLRKMKSSSCSVLHWENLFKTLLALVDIGKCINENSVHLDLLKDHMQYFGDSLCEITTVISTLCDFDESKLENRVVIRRGIDHALDEIKHIYRSLPSLLTRVAKEEADRLKAERCSVGYIPMVGYILQLPANFPVKNYPDLQLLFCNESDISVKSSKMEKLDQDLGDLKMQIIDKETTIMLRLQNLILKNTSLILGACRGAAILDAIISLALTAKYYGWSRPVLVEKYVIDAVEVNHPLALLVSKDHRFISNPVNSGGDHTKVKVFTGPNACGKSVYLKQVGVLAFLAHVGSFVPAKRAIIGPVNKIMTRMYTVDGVLDGMSTFAKDLTQVATALRRGCGNSLVIIDEFGKGTMTEVGLSLLVSSVNYWIRKGKETCPHLFVSSHFHALPELLVAAEDLVSFHTLEVIKRGARLIFKYRLVCGVVSKSFASYTASEMGVLPHIVERADEIYELLRRGGCLSEVKAMREEENKCDWLAQRVDSFMYEFETWDIDQDIENLISRIEEVFLLDDEILASFQYDKFSKTAETATTDLEELNAVSRVVSSQSYEQQLAVEDTSTRAAESKENELNHEVHIEESNEQIGTMDIEQILHGATSSPEVQLNIDYQVKETIDESRTVDSMTTPRQIIRGSEISHEIQSKRDDRVEDAREEIETIDSMLRQVSQESETIEYVANSDCSESSDCYPSKERSILKTPSSRSRGNLSVSFLLDENHCRIPEPTDSRPMKNDDKKTYNREASFVIPLTEFSTPFDFTVVDSQEDSKEDAPISFAIEDTLIDSPGRSMETPENVLETPKTPSALPMYTIKRNMDVSLLSCLSDEKTVPLKRLRSC